MRLPDWEERLSQLTHEAQFRAFKWGSFDCCTFAADAVEAVTGRDPMADLRKTYSSWRSAARVMREAGGVKGGATRALGRPMDYAKCAQRGDIVLVRGERSPALGVVVGQSALVPMQLGMQRVAMGDWLVAWRVE